MALLGFLVLEVLLDFLFLVATNPFAPLPFALLIVYPQVPRLIFLDERGFRDRSSFSATGSVFPPDLLGFCVFNHLENAGSAILFPRDFRSALSFRTCPFVNLDILIFSSHVSYDHICRRMEEDKKGFNIFLKQPTDLIDYILVVSFRGIKPSGTLVVRLCDPYRGLQRVCRGCLFSQHPL